MIGFLLYASTPLIFLITFSLSVLINKFITPQLLAITNLFKKHFRKYLISFDSNDIFRVSLDYNLNNRNGQLNDRRISPKI